MNKNIKKLINEVLKEEFQNLFEEPESETDVFGKYLFAPHRMDVPFEPNTEEEDKLFIDIENWIRAVTPIPMDSINLIKAVRHDNKYNEILKPPQNTNIYRFLYNIKDLSVLDVDPDKFIDDEQNQVKYYNQEFVLQPKNINDRTNGLQSWTLGGEKVFKAFSTDSIYLENQFVVVLITTTNPENGFFFLNPNMFKTLKGVSSLVDQEKEVISVGPVKVNRMIAFYKKNEKKYPTGFDYNLIK